jgi:quinol monooxygenase YgiN
LTGADAHVAPVDGTGVRTAATNERGNMTDIVKIFDVRLQPGAQSAAEDIITEFTPKGPAAEDGTTLFQVYRDTANADRLLFVEHFRDQKAYDHHVGSSGYKSYIEGRFAPLTTDIVVTEHEVVASKAATVGS